MAAFLASPLNTRAIVTTSVGRFSCVSNALKGR